MIYNSFIENMAKIQTVCLLLLLDFVVAVFFKYNYIVHLPVIGVNMFPMRE